MYSWFIVASPYKSITYYAAKVLEDFDPRHKQIELLLYLRVGHALSKTLSFPCMVSSLNI